MTKSYTPEDEEDYASLADEFNDEEGVDISDFDAEAVEGAKKYAKAHGLAWPPRVGDYDRYWERKND